MSPSASPAPPSLQPDAPAFKERPMLHSLSKLEHFITNYKYYNEPQPTGLGTLPPAACTHPPFVGVWPLWSPLGGGASPAPSPSGAAPAGAETAACGSWLVPLSAGPESAVFPAPGARCLCGVQAGRPALSVRPAAAQCGCPAVI